MKKIKILLAVFILSACASYPNSLAYRPEGSLEPPYVITSEINSFTNSVALFINGEQVITGRLSFLDMTGEFFGTYQKHNVNLSCRAGVAGCMVLIDNEFVGVIS